MPTNTINHVELTEVKANGDTITMYPINTGKDVKLDTSRNSTVFSGNRRVDNVEDLVNKAGEMMFSNGDTIVYLKQEDSTNPTPTAPTSEIDDNRVANTFTWSSDKINKNTVTNIPHHLVRNTDINKLFVSCTTFVIDTGRNASLKSFTPEPANNTTWYVNYVPLVHDQTTIDENPSVTSKIKKALQEWMKIPDDVSNISGLKKYYRIYSNGTWKGFFS